MHHLAEVSVSLKVTPAAWNIPDLSQTYSSLSNCVRNAAYSAAVLQTCTRLKTTTSQLCDAFARFWLILVYCSQQSCFNVIPFQHSQQLQIRLQWRGGTKNFWFTRERWKASQPSFHLSIVHTFHTRQVSLPDPTYLLIVLYRTEEDLECQVTNLGASSSNISY